MSEAALVRRVRGIPQRVIDQLPPQPQCPRPDKRAWPSKAAAKRVLRRDKTGKRGRNVYHCVCGAWHLGRRRD